MKEKKGKFDPLIRVPRGEHPPIITFPEHEPKYCPYCGRRLTDDGECPEKCSGSGIHAPVYWDK